MFELTGVGCAIPSNWNVIGGRFMGQDQAEAFGRRNAVPGELLVRLTPTQMFGEDDIAGW